MSGHHKNVKLLLGLYLFLVTCGCSALPEYARPRRASINLDQAASTQGITYRQLKRSDFQALSLPRDLSAHEKQIQAHSCIQIRPTRDTRYKIVPNKYDDQTFYFASLGHVGFEAFMVPGCSWWNPHMPKKRAAYVLEHEQIHFAITELAARRLTRQVRKSVNAILVIQPTRKQAFDELSSRIKALINEATNESLKEHTAFDEDTSMAFNPKLQRRWLDKINKMMNATQPK